MEELTKRITALFKLFKNKPHLLSKYLLERAAFKDEFIENILSSEKIDKLIESNMKIIKNFKTIGDMDDYYISLIYDIDSKNKKEKETFFNNKLKELIKAENYEEAAKIRDYMKRKNINKN